MEELDEEMIQFEKDHPSKKSSGSGNGGGGSMRILAIALAAVAVALLAALLVMMGRKNALVNKFYYFISNYKLIKNEYCFC